MTPDQAQQSINKLLAAWEDGDGGPSAWAWTQAEIRILQRIVDAG